MKLHVRRGVIGAGAGENAELRRRHGQRPASAEGVVDPHHRPPPQRLVIDIQRARVRHLEDRPQLQMVLQILADARQFMHHRDAVAGERRRARHPTIPKSAASRSRPRGSENHLAAPAPRLAVPSPACRTPTARLSSNKYFHLRAGDERQIGAVQHRLEKAARRAPASAALLVHLKIGRAKIVARIEVLRPGNADFLGRVEHRVENFPARARLLDAPLSARAVKGARRRRNDPPAP